MSDLVASPCSVRVPFRARLQRLWHRVEEFLPRSYRLRNSNLVAFARRELQAAGYDLSDKAEGPNKWMVDAVLDLVEAFADQGHSGYSAQACIATFSKVARFQPLTPLTGAADEWNEIGPDIYQNNRCGHVFKEAGRAYDSQGRLFRDPDGGVTMTKDSRVDVKFPYTPTTVYVDRA